MAMMTQARAACQLLQVGELAVTMARDSPLIPATINGHAVQLLLDTGAAKSLIWRSAAAEFNLKITSSGGTFYGAGGADVAGIVSVRDFGVAGGTVHNIQLYAAGRGGSPGNSAGILGEDVLSKWDIELDLSEGKVRLFSPKNCTGDEVVYWAQSYFMTKLLKGPGETNWLEVNVSLDGHPVVAMFDSGAVLSAITPQALQQTGIKPETPLVTGTATRGLAGKAIDTATAVFSSLTIGQESIANANLHVADLFSRNTESHLGSLIPQSALDMPGMIIGADFLMAHRLYLARSQGKVYFTYKGGPVFRRITPNAAPSGEASPGDPIP
jgi:predicted aspartyl protease